MVVLFYQQIVRFAILNRYISFAISRLPIEPTYNGAERVVLFMIGERLAELRKDKNWSQADLANELSVTKDTIGNYERNIREPDDATKIKIAKLFNVSADYLLGIVDDEISYDRAEYIPLPRKASPEFKQECEYLVDLLKNKYKL